MRYTKILLNAVLCLVCNQVYAAEAPPFDTLSIGGFTDEIKYNKVSLFKSGSSKRPYKSEKVASRDGQYSIDISIPSEMRQKDHYYVTDMRFWGDKNANGTWDKGEPRSACHFIIWWPPANEVYMQIYEGEKHHIKSSDFTYDYL